MHQPASNAKVCLMRADEAAAIAASTNLPNVRVRQLFAEQTWREMAARMLEAKVRAAETIAAKGAMSS